MSEVVGEAVVKVRTDDTGADFDKKGKEAGGRFSEGFRENVKDLAKIATAAFAADKIVDFTKEAITGASDMNETLSKTNVVFGKASDQVVKFASQGATAFGQSKQAVLDAAGTFGVFGKAAGLTGPKLGKFSTSLAGLASDLASFHNTSPEEAVDALGAALRGESEPMRRYGVLLDDASLRQEAFKQGLIDSTKNALTPQQKTLAAQALIMRQTKIAQGDFARTSGGLANQQRILAAQFEDLRTKIGGAFLPVVLGVVKSMNSVVFPAFEKLGPVLSAAGGVIEQALVPLGAALAPVITELKTSIGFIAKAFQALFSDSKDPIGGFAELLDAAFGNTGNLVQPITHTVESVITLFDQLKASAMEFLPVIGDTFTNTLLPAIVTVGTYIATSLYPIFLQVATIIATQIVPTFAQVAVFLYGTLYPAIIQIYAAIAENLKPVFDALVVTLQTQVLPAISRAVETIQTQLIPALEPIILVIVQVVGAFAKFAAHILGVVLPIVIRLAGFFLANLIPAIVNTIVIIVRIIGVLVQLGVGIARAIAAVVGFGAALVRLVDTGLDAVFSAIVSLPGRIIALGGRFLSAGKSLIHSFIDGLKSAGSFASGIADSVWNAVRGVINSAIDRLNGLLDFTIKVGPKSFHVSAPNIGHLQAGTGPDGLATGGAFTVGEVGRETVILPAGTKVLTTAQTKQAEARATGSSPDAGSPPTVELSMASILLLVQAILEGAQRMSQQTVSNTLVGLAVG